MASPTAAARYLLPALSCYLYGGPTSATDPSPTPTTLLSPVVQRWARNLGFGLRGDEIRAFAAELSLCASPPRTLASPSGHGLHRAKEEAAAFFHGGSYAYIVHGLHRAKEEAAAFFHGGSYAYIVHGRADDNAIHFGSASTPPRALQGVEELGTHLVLARGFFAPTFPHAMLGAEELGARLPLASCLFASALPHDADKISIRLALGRGFAASDMGALPRYKDPVARLARGLTTPSSDRAINPHSFPSFRSGSKGNFACCFTQKRNFGYIPASNFYATGTHSPTMRANGQVKKFQSLGPVRSFGGGPLCQGTLELLLVSGEDLLITNVHWAARTWDRMTRSQRAALLQRGTHVLFLACCGFIAYREKTLDRAVKDKAREIATPTLAVNDFNKSIQGRNKKASVSK